MSRPWDEAGPAIRCPVDPVTRLIENARTLLPAARATGETVMWDVVMLALGLGFFAAGIGYAYVCERL
jgi:hypothetical protein